MSVCVCAYVRACVRVCVRVWVLCVYACVRVVIILKFLGGGGVLLCLSLCLLVCS